MGRDHKPLTLEEVRALQADAGKQAAGTTSSWNAQAGQTLPRHVTPWVSSTDRLVLNGLNVRTAMEAMADFRMPEEVRRAPWPQRSVNKLS